MGWQICWLEIRNSNIKYEYVSFRIHAYFHPPIFMIAFLIFMHTESDDVIVWHNDTLTTTFSRSWLLFTFKLLINVFAVMIIKLPFFPILSQNLENARIIKNNNYTRTTTEIVKLWFLFTKMFTITSNENWPQ